MPKHRATWFVREGHPLTRHDVIEVQQLAGYRVVSVPLPEEMLESLRKWLRFPPKEEIEFHLTCNDVSVLWEYTRKTDALLLLPEHTGLERERSAGLVARSVPSRSQLWLQFAIVHQCSVPLIRAQRLCSFARMESAKAVHMNGLQFSL